MDHFAVSKYHVWIIMCTFKSWNLYNLLSIVHLSWEIPIVFCIQVCVLFCHPNGLSLLYLHRCVMSSSPHGSPHNYFTKSSEQNRSSGPVPVAEGVCVVCMHAHLCCTKEVFGDRSGVRWVRMISNSTANGSNSLNSILCQATQGLSHERNERHADRWAFNLNCTHAHTVCTRLSFLPPSPSPPKRACMCMRLVHTCTWHIKFEFSCVSGWDAVWFVFRIRAQPTELPW